MATHSFRWEVPPSAVGGNVRAYEQRVLQGIGALTDLFAARIEAYAKSNAPWGDRTGAARQGVRAFAVKEAARVVIYLVHSVHYGAYLELGTSRMAPRPIVMRALQAHFAPLMAAVRSLVGGR